MIPRLWSCTSHPQLEWLALPFNPIVLLGLFLLTAALPANASWSFRALRLWQTLLAAVLGSIALIALAAGVSRALGGRGNPVFVSARYVFPVAAWAAVAVGLAWGSRSAQRVDTLEQGVQRVGPTRLLIRVSAVLAALLLMLIVARQFIADFQRPWSLPYEIAEWYFDDATMDLASDECLAFRVTDDLARHGSSDPGAAARYRLRRSGHSAVPGVADYLADRLVSGRFCPGGPCGASIELLAFLAETGDHPLLAAYDRYPLLMTREMRKCLHSGRKVKWAVETDWQCIGPAPPAQTTVQ